VIQGNYFTLGHVNFDKDVN